MPVDHRAVLTRPAPPPDHTLRYGDHPDQVADLRLPSGTASAPLVVVIHGGFWRAAYDRAHTGPLAADLAARGWAVAQLEYRRTGQPGGGWPGTFADVAAGLSLVPALAAEVAGVAVGPPVLLGHSAGGHLALWWAGLGRVRAVVALAPVGDPVSAHRLGLDDGAVAELLGGGPEERAARYAYARPAPAADVPVTVVHGTEDVQVPVAMSRDLVARLRAARAGGPGRTGPDGGSPAGSAGGAPAGSARPSGPAPVALVELPGVEHFALIDPESDAWPAVVRALDALAPAPGRPRTRD